MTPAATPRPMAKNLGDASLAKKAAQAPKVVHRPAPITSANAMPTFPDAVCKHKHDHELSTVCACGNAVSTACFSSRLLRCCLLAIHTRSTERLRPHQGVSTLLSYTIWSRVRHMRLCTRDCEFRSSGLCRDGDARNHEHVP